MKKPTFRQIAELAQVGTATVERVLNGRGGVRPDTVARVLGAARALDWPGRMPEAHRGLLRIEVILVRPDSGFFSRLAAGFRRIAASLDPIVRVQVNFLEELDAAAIARRVAVPEGPRAALVIAAPDARPVREALAAVVASGLPVVQVVTRIDPGAAFVGIDNHAAGRMAARMVARLATRPGPIVALCHSGGYEVHRMRVRGFSGWLAENPPPGMPFVHVAFGQDSRDVSRRRMIEVLREWPDLAAVYNAGGANVAVLDVLAHHPRPVFFAGHELTDVTAAALRAGTAGIVFDQIPEAQARRAIDLILARLGLTDLAIDNPPIRFSTVTAENL